MSRESRVAGLRAMAAQNKSPEERDIARAKLKAMGVDERIPPKGPLHRQTTTNTTGYTSNYADILWRHRGDTKPPQSESEPGFGYGPDFDFESVFKDFEREFQAGFAEGFAFDPERLRREERERRDQMRAARAKASATESDAVKAAKGEAKAFREKARAEGRAKAAGMHAYFIDYDEDGNPIRRRV